MGRTKKAGEWIKPEGWGGGRAWRSPDGTITYHIRRMVDGRVFDVSTRATTRSAAEEQLKRFEADPAAYRPGGADPIYLDAELVKSFLAWSKDKGNSERWIYQQKRYLAWWAERLAGVDLRHCSLRDRITPALDRPDGRQCRPQRIAVLKVLYSWLRTERHMIATAEDPTFGQLKVPQSKPEQLRRVKALPREHVALAIEHLAPRWADLLRFLAGTGAHVAELERFAASGSIEKLPRDGKAEGAAGVVVLPATKAGDPLRIAVTAEVLEAAKRVREAGAFDRQKLDKAIRAACAAAGIPAFGPGRLRHTVATIAINAGANPAAVAAFLNHKSPRTTRRFYATHATPMKVPTAL